MAFGQTPHTIYLEMIFNLGTTPTHPGISFPILFRFTDPIENSHKSLMRSDQAELIKTINRLFSENLKNLYDALHASSLFFFVHRPILWQKIFFCIKKTIERNAFCCRLH